jgi:hypothetical protein
VDPRIARIRRKLAEVPYRPNRSHSFGEEHHQFRLAPPLTDRQAAQFEAANGIDLPAAFRDFLTALGSVGASPFYRLLPLGRRTFSTMAPQGEPGAPRGFTAVDPLHHPSGDLFLDIIEAGCSDVVLLGITGPLTGRVLTGNSDGFWGPNVSSATDFLAWYERWLDQMAAGQDNRALGLTSPGVHAQRWSRNG